jgi:hypothetical protein
VDIANRQHVRLPSFRALSRLLLAVGACLAGALALSPLSRAQAASWQFAPVSAPAPANGTPPGPNPVPLGQIGQISFWAPNRGLLITGGTEGVNDAPSGGVVPAGVWAYNGADWHELSSVCGGAYGRIAWAGPDEFWTISDQRPGQAVAGTEPDLRSLSLCHFDDGQVVASYAMPLEEPSSYQPMDAAACAGPDDCWFGGQDDASGHAFELHWDGANVTELDEPEDHAVNDMLDYQGQIDESVRFAPGDALLPSENPAHPAVLHQIEGTQVLDQFTFGEGRILPYYGTDVAPDALEGFALSTDGGAMGAGASQLWAAADPEASVSPSASLTILRHTTSGWTQVTPAVPGATTPSCASGPALSDPAAPIDAVTDDSLASNLGTQGTGDGAIAAMPGSGEAWISLPDSVPDTAANPNGVEPDVALIDSSGCIQSLDNPDDQDSSDATTDATYASVFTQAFTQAAGQSSTPGAAGPIDCPADNDCWMADSDGWLYQYTDGTQYPVDGDPNFAGVITVRPADGATVTVFGDVAPPDDSGTGQAFVAPTGPPAKVVIRTKGVVVRLTRVKARVVHHTELVLTFHLNTRARIQIIAERHGKVVGHSQRRVLAAGRRTLTLKLNPKHWPNHLKVNASPVTKKSKQK